MRVLVQRVTSARVTVAGEVVGEITPATQGLLALVGVTHDDEPAKAQRLAEKLWQLRILDGEKSASDIGAPILVVSQFTLYGNTTKGRRPTWNAAAPGGRRRAVGRRVRRRAARAGGARADRRVRRRHGRRTRQRRSGDGAAGAVSYCVVVICTPSDGWTITNPLP